MTKRELYESIMSELAPKVKRMINEMLNYGQHMNHNYYGYNVDAMVSDTLYGNSRASNSYRETTVGNIGARMKALSLPVLFPDAIDNFHYERVRTNPKWKCVFTFHEDEMWESLEDDLRSKIRNCELSINMIESNHGDSSEYKQRQKKYEQQLEDVINNTSRGKQRTKYCTEEIKKYLNQHLDIKLKNIAFNKDLTELYIKEDTNI